MRVLLDECSPAPLKRSLKQFEVFTIEEVGLKGFGNGNLIVTAEGKFDVLLTADKNLRYQQNLTGRRLAIVELPFNSWPQLKPLVRVIEAVQLRVKPGDYLIIPAHPELLSGE